MNWETAGRIAMMAALQAHRDFDVDVSERIDVFKVIESAQILLGFQPFPRLSAAYFAEPRLGIVINENHPLARQRYSAAHELGHHVFGHGTVVDSDTDILGRGGRSINDNEKLSEAFAAWFLMPDDLVRAKMEHLAIARVTSPADVYRLALHLGTSYEATAYHLVHLRLASIQQRKAWLSVRPSAVKTSLAKNWTPANLHNDVWLLDQEDSGSKIVVRPGDRLIFRLKETPTSGYTWSLIEPANCVVLADEYTQALITNDAHLPAREIVVGASRERLLVLEPPADTTEPIDGHLELGKFRPWVQNQRSASMEIAIKIEPARHGFSETRFSRAA